MKGEIYHVDIVVSNVKKSVEFYDAFLGWLGYQRIFYEKEEAGWALEAATSGWTSAGTDSFNTGIIGSAWA